MSDLWSRILNANERAAAPHGAKMLIVGETGVGKTSLARTLDTGSGILIDVEAGTLAIADVAIDTATPRTWPQIRDITVALAGADPAVPTNVLIADLAAQAPAHGRSRRPAAPLGKRHLEVGELDRQRPHGAFGSSFTSARTPARTSRLNRRSSARIS
jgi:energy-coupling factor transporter ATP-binding protein EcfA2